VLPAAGGDEEQLDGAVHAVPARVEEEAADGAAEGGAARLVRLDDLDALAAQPGGGAPQVGRLAAAVEALEGDEGAAHGRGS
jgi:hypothetical protein